MGRSMPQPWLEGLFRLTRTFTILTYPVDTAMEATPLPRKSCFRSTTLLMHSFVLRSLSVPSLPSTRSLRSGSRKRLVHTEPRTRSLATHGGPCPTRQYFAIHVFANAVITALTWRGALETLQNPSKTTYVWLPTAPASQLYLVWVYAVHIYHPIFFRTNLMDWIHHVPVYLLK